MEQLSLFGKKDEMRKYKITYSEPDSRGRLRIHRIDIPGRDASSAMESFRNYRTILSVNRL